MFPQTLIKLLHNVLIIFNIKLSKHMLHNPQLLFGILNFPIYNNIILPYYLILVVLSNLEYRLHINEQRM